jgi:hypothetical protein
MELIITSFIFAMLLIVGHLGALVRARIAGRQRRGASG